MSVRLSSDSWQLAASDSCSRHRCQLQACGPLSARLQTPVPWRPTNPCGSLRWHIGILLRFSISQHGKRPRRKGLDRQHSDLTLWKVISQSYCLGFGPWARAERPTSGPHLTLSVSASAATTSGKGAYHQKIQGNIGEHILSASSRGTWNACLDPCAPTLVLASGPTVFRHVGFQVKLGPVTLPNR